MATQLTGNFNDNSLAAVVNRINNIHVIDDPVLLSAKDGMYAVHDSSFLDSFMEKDIQIYTKAEYDEKFGDDKPITLNQLKSDLSAVDGNRIGGPVDSNFWMEKRGAMEYRIDKIEESVKELGLNIDDVACEIKAPAPIQ